MRRLTAIQLIFCGLGLWLVWEFRLLGLFTYAATLYGSRYFGVLPTSIQLKIKEKETLWVMYGFTFAVFGLALSMGVSGWFQPISLKLATSATLPSLYDNAVLFINSSGDTTASLLADVEEQKKRKLLLNLSIAKQSRIYSPTLFQAVSITSFATSAAFVFLTAKCLFKARLPYVDEQEISKMNARATVNITHEIEGVRRVYRIGGLFFLLLFFVYFVLSRIGVENVGIFVARRPYIIFSGLLMQLIMQLILWNFARHPFFPNPKYIVAPFNSA